MGMYVISDSDNTMSNTWYPIVQEFFKSWRKYGIDMWAMNKKNGIFDATASGTLEFTKRELREDLYHEFTKGIKSRVKGKKIISKKNVEAIKELNRLEIPIIVYSGNYEDVVRYYFEQYPDLDIKGIYGYRYEDFLNDQKNNFEKPTNKKKILSRAIKEENINPKDIVLIEDGPKALKNAKEEGIIHRYGIYTIGFPGRDILIPLPRFISYKFNGVNSNWSFATAVDEIINDGYF